jgi:hypothetical protein
MKKLLITAAALTTLLFSGCFLIEQKTAILWTDIPEVAAYVEIFNASQTNYRVELVYSDNPADFHKLTADGGPDIVISENLASNSIISAFAPLDKMIEEGRFDPSTLYTNLLNLGVRENIQYILPISFNIPAIMYKQGTLSKEVTGTTINPQQLKIEAQLFNERSTAKFPVKGFVPTWTPDFLLKISFINDSGFAETEDGNLIWNNDNLTSSIEFTRDWTENINSGWAEEADFTKTYCYDPGYKLLNAERIGFHYTTLRDFYTIPSEDRSALEYKWLGEETSIPVCRDIVFTGIPKQSTKKKTAEAFIIWLLDAETQKTLLESSHFKRTRTFGICDGLSSITSVNQLLIPAHYTRMIGAVPGPEYIDFPKNLPAEWQQITNDVLIPWLLNQNSEEPLAEPLAETLKTWTLQEKKE